LVGAHLRQPIPEPPSRNPGHHTPEAPATPSAAEGLAALGSGVGELKILYGDRSAAVGLGKGDELADRGSQPPIPGRRALILQVEGDRNWMTDRVA
jgi:hypothetical protein